VHSTPLHTNTSAPGAGCSLKKNGRPMNTMVICMIIMEMGALNS